MGGGWVGGGIYFKLQAMAVLRFLILERRLCKDLEGKTLNILNRETFSFSVLTEFLLASALLWPGTLFWLPFFFFFFQTTKRGAKSTGDRPFLSHVTQSGWVPSGCTGWCGFWNQPLLLCGGCDGCQDNQRMLRNDCLCPSSSLYLRGPSEGRQSTLIALRLHIPGYIAIQYYLGLWEMQLSDGQYTHLRTRYTFAWWRGWCSEIN